MAAAVATTEARPVAPPAAVAPQASPWVVALAAAHVPLVVSYYYRLWNESHYQFFPLALGAAYLFYRRDRVEGAEAARRGDRRGLGLLFTLGLGTLAAAVAVDSPWLAVVAALVNLAAWAVDRGGWAELRRLIPAGLMIVITLRPPMGYDDRLIKLLQRITAQSASAVLDLLGVTHALSGNVIEIPGRRLLVEEACSGVNSFFSATACVLFYVLWNRRGWISSLLLFLSIPFWVVFANTMRVVTVTALRSKWGIAADEGWLHEALGLGVFLVAVAMIVSTERLLRFYAVLLERPQTPKPAPAAASRAPRSTARVWQIAGGVAVLLCLLQVPSVWARVNQYSQEWSLPPVAEFGESWLPETFGPWKRVKYEVVERDRNSPLGTHSQTWSLVGDEARAAVSFDYAFLGWHELTECYESQGWRAEDRKVITDPSDGTVQGVEIALRHDQTARYARLFFALHTRDGVAFPVRARGEVDEWLDRAAGRWRTLTSFQPADPARDERLTYQLQLFVESYAPLGAKQIDILRNQFFDVRRQAAAKLQTETGT